MKKTSNGCIKILYVGHMVIHNQYRWLDVGYKVLIPLGKNRKLHDTLMGGMQTQFQGDAPFFRSCFIQTLGKMRKGEKKLPQADIQQTTVTRIPLSAKVSLPICFGDRRPMIRVGFVCTVVTPVSSTLKIL